MSNHVPDDGIGSEPIAVIGEAPGRWEDLKKRPFVGPSGHRLAEWQLAAGLGRKDCYWTNVVPYRPAGNDIHTVPRRELDDWAAELHRRLAALTGPVVLVPTGDTALYALTGKKGITKWRGSILEYVSTNGKKVIVIPTIHPAATFRSPSLEKRCRYDWVRIASESRTATHDRPQRHLAIRPTLSDVRDLLADVRRQPDGILGVDIETPRTVTLVDKKLKSGKVKVVKSYGAARITCVAFALQANEAISIPTTEEYWGSARDVREVWALVRALCAAPIAKALQNGLFDAFYLADHEVTLANFVYDTMDQHHALDSTDEHSLAYIASTWTREPYWKDDGKDDDDFGGAIGDLDTFWTYNARDAAVTRELAPVLRDALIEDKRWDLYLEHYPPLRAPLLAMMRAGIRRDTAAAATMAKELGATNAGLRLALDDRVRRSVAEAAVGRDPALLQAKLTEMALTREGKACTVFGPKSVSPKKLAWYLYDVLRLPKRTRKNKTTGQRAVTTDEVALRGLWLAHPTKVGAFMPDLLAHRRNDKVGSFLKEEVADADGYVRCSYRRATETHRLSSSKNPRRTGQNLQNVDRAVRRVYVPDAGTCFVECDLSQAEDRVVKAYTGDPTLLAEARSHPADFDTHAMNAVRIFNVLLHEVTYDQRYLGKKTVHASNYGMHGRRLSEELLKEGYVRTEDECERMIERRLEAAPAILDWQQRTRMEVMRTRTITNSWGWPLSFAYERLGDEVYRRAYAYRPQSDIGILTNLWGLVPLYAWLLEQRRRERTDAWRRTRLVLQVHDALVVCAPPETAYTVACFMRQTLERPHLYGGVELTIPVEVSVSASWAKGTSWKRFPERDAFEAAMRAL